MIETLSNGSTAELTALIHPQTGVESSHLKFQPNGSMTTYYISQMKPKEITSETYVKVAVEVDHASPCSPASSNLHDIWKGRLKYERQSSCVIPVALSLRDNITNSETDRNKATLEL